MSLKARRLKMNTVVAVLDGTSSAGDRASGAEMSSPVKQAAETKSKAEPTAVAPSAGAVDVVMPQMGESIFEGTISSG